MTTGPTPLGIDLTGRDPGRGLPGGVEGLAVVRTWLPENTTGL
ncbi:hypothetical protein GCM10009827_015820 [Dactylosporangium maewongense]|uniref:Uncharacterized protein n=1 Tax=Dactylosporangium maewongense TaxID=634393 RepID=A0ABP4KJ62_9ACTN